MKEKTDKDIEEIKKLYGEGLGVRAISRRLGCSVNTVRKYCMVSDLAKSRKEPKSAFIVPEQLPLSVVMQDKPPIEPMPEPEPVLVPVPVDYKKMYHGLSDSLDVQKQAVMRDEVRNRIIFLIDIILFVVAILSLVCIWLYPYVVMLYHYLI